MSSVNPKDFAVGDTVVFIADPAKGTRKVGVITMNNYVDSKIGEPPDDWQIASPKVEIEDRDGEKHMVYVQHITKPLETTPQAFWSRWAHGAAMVEEAQFADHAEDDGQLDAWRERWNDEFRWLFDGYRYSPGGRIQLGLGHEYLGLDKANLTLVNCFVGPSVEGDDEPVAQWRKVLANLRNQIEIQRRGGGYGVNISKIKTVRGPLDRMFVGFHLPHHHKDYDELEALRDVGKFDAVHAVGRYVEPLNGEHVILVPDSIDGIMSALDEMVTKIYEGQDVIVSFGALRPRHAPVSNIGRSSGAASWMTLFALAVSLLRQETIDAVDFAELFAFTTNLVEQGGSRRGALMLVYNVDGEVIEKFVTRKRESGRLVGANVSVGVTDAFMERVKHAQSWVDVGAHEAHYWEDRKAHRIWSLIIESARNSAEPGVIFIDRVNSEGNVSDGTPMDASNPCGEQPLPPHGSCNLGHLVLPRFVKGDWTKSVRLDGHRVPNVGTLADVDYASLERAVRLGVRFQDNMIDYTNFPTPETKARQQLERRVGMGTMGLGTLSIMLGLRYGSDEHLSFINDLYAQIAYWAYDESMNLAAEKGAFPAFDYEKYRQSGFVKRLLAKFPELDEKLRTNGIRNVTLLTQAPTGTTGTMIDNVPGMNVSTGIEPYYSWVYYRAGRLGVASQEVELVRQYREANGLAPDDALPDYFVTAMELAPDDHVRVQATVQRWVDSAISKTANAPATFTVDDTAKLYELAYDLGCKGVTIYVDGSRQAQVLATTKEAAKIEAHIEADAMMEKEDVDRIAAFLTEDAMKRTVVTEVAPNHYEFSIDEKQRINDWIAPAVTESKMRNSLDFPKRGRRRFGFTDKLDVPIGDERLGKVYVTVTVDDDGRPFEVFVNANDAELADIASTLGRLTTQLLRYGGTSDNVEQAIKHLKRSQSNMFSLPSQIARLLNEVANKGVEFPRGVDEVVGPTDEERREMLRKAVEVFELYGAPKIVNSPKLAKCSSCGEEAYDKANCVCHACGMSKCS